MIKKITTLKLMKHLLNLTVDISVMLAPQNIVCQMHLFLYIIDKKEKQNKKSGVDRMILNVSHIVFHGYKCGSHDLALANSIMQSFRSIQEM